MLLRVLIIAAALIPLAAISAPKINEQALRAAMDDILKDAPSARFKNIRHKAGEGNGVWYICGEVNSKNSYGAYAGFTPFHGIAITSKGKKTDYIIRGASEDSGYVCEKLFGSESDT